MWSVDVFIEQPDVRQDPWNSDLSEGSAVDSPPACEWEKALLFFHGNGKADGTGFVLWFSCSWVVSVFLYYSLSRRSHPCGVGFGHAAVAVLAQEGRALLQWGTRGVWGL